MKKKFPVNYYFPKLTDEELHLYQDVCEEEAEKQTWYAINYSELLGQEVEMVVQ